MQEDNNCDGAVSDQCHIGIIVWLNVLYKIPGKNGIGLIGEQAAWLLRMNGGLPESVQQFIIQHVLSVERLEILMLLSDSPDRWWAAEEVFRSIQSSRASVIRHLQIMVEKGILRLEPEQPFRYQFRPATEELLASVNSLKVENRIRPVKVITAIISVSDPMRTFGDAFKLRKEE